ncbi:TIGR04219 family outer membrane beta-barrel protein [Vibrio sp. JC009]|uniref:TIGR04219 family outer membrane beta-barrel protein n=1 Tax=Vibrio sp. JC009 TaxID=2912314 RepID=UPI0023AFF466|nr:TIGR04219 family outer membrane beta-barrel protein [Vibrio sp. JC009]WED24518.1 TIGR04219 family outer membrane beta-barrel protein [Vibrio sp. JC009]
MKRSMLSLLVAASAFSVQADTLMGGDVEVNAWQQDYTYAGNDDGDSTTYTFEASFEHPIPLIPNVKVAQSSVDANRFEYTKRDYTLYYEILDNSLVSVDVGAGATSLTDGKLTVLGSEQDFEGYVPHLYGMAEVGIPATPISFFAKGTGIAYEDNEMMDLAAGVKYEIGLGLVGLELQLGYRTQTFKLEGFDDLSVDLDTEAKGFYAGANLDF